MDRFCHGTPVEYDSDTYLKGCQAQTGNGGYQSEIVLCRVDAVVLARVGPAGYSAGGFLQPAVRTRRRARALAGCLPARTG